MFYSARSSRCTKYLLIMLQKRVQYKCWSITNQLITITYKGYQISHAARSERLHTKWQIACFTQKHVHTNYVKTPCLTEPYLNFSASPLVGMGEVARHWFDSGQPTCLLEARARARPQKLEENLEKENHEMDRDRHEKDLN